MATPLIRTEAKRTCEQSLAFRATVSPPHLRRRLPKPALPWVDGPSPAQVLRLLLGQLDSPRASVYRRIAEQALADNDADRIASATRSVQDEINRCRTAAEKLHQVFPLLYPKPAA